MIHPTCPHQTFKTHNKCSYIYIYLFAVLWVFLSCGFLARAILFTILWLILLMCSIRKAFAGAFS